MNKSKPLREDFHRQSTTELKHFMEMVAFGPGLKGGCG